MRVKKVPEGLKRYILENANQELEEIKCVFKNDPLVFTKKLVRFIENFAPKWRPVGGRRDVTLRSFVTMIFLIEELLQFAPPQTGSNVVVGTLKPNIHRLGPLVAELILKARGFNVMNLGIEVEPRILVTKILDYNAKIAIACGYVGGRETKKRRKIIYRTNRVI